MIVVVDANIIVSAIINPQGNIPYILFNASSKIEFVVPQFIMEEIALNQSKIINTAKIPKSVFSSRYNAIQENLLLFSDDLIDEESLQYALSLTKHIDEKDTIYVAFAIALDGLFWTGDIKLKNGLAKRGFMHAVSTKQLTEIIKGI